MNRVIHFEMQATEPDRAAEFYQEVFGWIVTKKTSGNEDYWLIATGRGTDRGINGGMKQRADKQTGMIPTIEVEDADAAVKLILEKGGKLLEKTKALSGTGYLAYCADPEGNTFAILEYSANVK